MAEEKVKKKAILYQVTVTLIGASLWIFASVGLFFHYELKDFSIVLLLILFTVFIGSFSQTFRVPFGLGFTQEKISYTLTDAISLLTAVLYGPIPTIVVAGIDGFISSWRTLRLPRSLRKLYDSSFSSAIVSLSGLSSALTVQLVLRYEGGRPNFITISVSLLFAGFILFAINTILLSTLLALRRGEAIVGHWKSLFAATPVFLPNVTAATLMYMALQYDLLIVPIIGVPVLLAAYWGHRQYSDSVMKRVVTLEKAHRETIEALAVAINAKDEVTHDHVLRVQIYAEGVARLLGCTHEQIEALKAGALLHDIGKIAVPDYILNKPGKLTAAEFEKMKYHTIAGAQILSRVEFPYPIVPVVRHHHERWDGKGYPDGLKSDEIPLTARILSVVDCFDAVREDRQYRKGMTREEAIELLLRNSGSQYDPRIVATFIENLPKFEKEIAAIRDVPAPTFGIEAFEELSEAAKLVAPGAGLAEDDATAANGAMTPIEDGLRAVCDLARDLIGKQSQEEIFSTMTQRLKAVLPYDLCLVTQVMPATGHNLIVHAEGRDAEWCKGQTLNLGEGVTGWVIANHKPFFNTDPKLDLSAHLEDKASNYHTLAAVPLCDEEVLYGAVTIYSTELAEYNSYHQKLFSESVSLAAKALSSIPEGENLKRATGSLKLDKSLMESKLTH